MTLAATTVLVRGDDYSRSMVGKQATRPSGRSSALTSVERALNAVRIDACAVMLYGSRARGTERPDSDIDILALVETKPGSVQFGNVSITYYTSAHLLHMAESGSLFIKHLRDEGSCISDPAGLLNSIFAVYTPRSNYDSLRSDLAAVLSALSVSDRKYYADGLIRAGVWAARSAVYVVGAEREELSFDTLTACERASVPELAGVLRDRSIMSVDQLRELGLQALGVTRVPLDLRLASVALSFWESNPMAAKILESILAGRSQLEYTHLTLPIV